MRLVSVLEDWGLALLALVVVALIGAIIVTDIRRQERHVRREAWSAGYRRSDCDRTGDPDSCAMAKRYECAQGHGVTPDSEPHVDCRTK